MEEHFKNVLLGAEINKSVSQETKQRAKELLRQYGLKRFINSRPSELSGGMRQSDSDPHSHAESRTAPFR